MMHHEGDNPNSPLDGMTVRLAVAILQAALDCVIVVDHESRIVEWNEAAALTFGYSRQEAIGQSLAELIIPPALRVAHYAGFNHYLTTKEGPILNRRIEVPAIRRDGTEFPVELAVVPILEEPPRFAAYLRDISARKESEIALIQSEARQRIFLRDVLSSVTEGRFCLCETANDLPPHLPATNPTVVLRTNTLKVLRRQINEAALLAGINKERGDDLLTAASEAAMNAVVHAGGGSATVGADTQGGVVQVWVEDTGKGIEMNRLPRATLQRDYSTARTLGHGFKLTLTTADKVWLLTGPSGTTVVIEQNRVAPLPEWLTSLV